jgi:sugar lactone lactonase YvrE
MNYHVKNRGLFILFIGIAIYSFTGCSNKKSNPNPVDNTTKVSIASLNVNSGIYTATVVITGTGFSSNTANNEVFFNGKAATVTAATSTQLTVVVPLSAGTGNVSVKISGGTEVSGPSFTYQESWVVSTFAGSGVQGFKNATGKDATFNTPTGLAFDGNGNLFVAEEGNDAIRKITPDGVVTTVAGGGPAGAIDGNGTSATFQNPAGLTVDNTGNIYVADYANHMIRKIDVSNNVTTFAGHKAPGFDNGKGTAASFAGPTDIKIDASGSLYVADFVNEAIRKITVDGIVSTFASVRLPVDQPGFNFPEGIAFDQSNNLYATTSSLKIKKITPTGVVSTFAGSGLSGSDNGPADKASFYSMFSLTVDKDGNVYVTDNNTIRKIKSDGSVTTVAGLSTAGAIDGGVAIAAFNRPYGIALDKAGNIFVADMKNNLIRKIAFE